MKRVPAILSISLLIVLGIASCKNDDTPTQNNNNTTPPTCNFTTDVVAVNGATNNVLRTINHVVGTYIAEFLIDTSSAPTGVALVFATTVLPDAGTYAIEADPGQVGTGEVYVEYYNATTAWHATTGTVTVTASGAQRIITFCSLVLVAAPTDTKTVSIRGTCS